MRIKSNTFFLLGGEVEEVVEAYRYWGVYLECTSWGSLGLLELAAYCPMPSESLQWRE